MVSTEVQAKNNKPQYIFTRIDELSDRLRNVKALFLIVGVGKGRWQNDPYGNV
jgi:hypothetical protein